MVFTKAILHLYKVSSHISSSISMVKLCKPCLSSGKAFNILRWNSFGFFCLHISVKKNDAGERRSQFPQTSSMETFATIDLHL